MLRFLALAVLALAPFGCAGTEAAAPGDPPVVAKLAPVPAQPAPAALTTEWPLFRGSPQMLGTGTAKLPDQLDELWAFKTGNGIEGAPAVVADVVYVA